MSLFSWNDRRFPHRKVYLSEILYNWAFAGLSIVLGSAFCGLLALIGYGLYLKATAS